MYFLSGLENPGWMTHGWYDMKSFGGERIGGNGETRISEEEIFEKVRKIEMF